MARRTYTEQERREVLADVPTLGVKAAAKEHGVPPTTVQSWIDRGKANGTAAEAAAETRTNGSDTARSGRRRYSEEHKRQVVADAVKRGVCAAAREHGVAESNVSRWRDRYGASGQDEPRAEPEDSAPAAAERAEIETSRARRKHVAKTYTPSQKAEAIEYAAAHGVSAASAALGMSRHSLYQWQHQVERFSLRSRLRHFVPSQKTGLPLLGETLSLAAMCALDTASSSRILSSFTTFALIAQGSPTRGPVAKPTVALALPK